MLRNPNHCSRCDSLQVMAVQCLLKRGFHEKSVPLPHRSRELAELVRAGFAPIDALRAGTRGAAQFLGCEGEFGTIEAGKIADLVLLDANPLENITKTRKISAVIRGGKYFDRAALDNLLAQAKSAAAAVE